VTAGYPDRAHQAAAIEVMLKTINTNGLPQADAAKYRDALGQIDPPWANDHAAFEKQWWPLADDPQFRYEVVRRYLPSMASRVAGQIHDAQEREQGERLMQKAADAVCLLGLEVLAVPLLFLLVPWRVSGKTSKIPDEKAGPLRLPEALRRVKVFRKSYPVVFDAGQIFEKNEWSETRSYTTTAPGRTYTIGDTTYVEQGTTTTHYSTTKYHRYWLNTPDGRKAWFTYSDNVFLANEGNIVSSFDSVGTVFMAFNHTTGDYVRLDAAFKTLHRYPGRWVWLLTILGAGVLAWLLAGDLGLSDLHDTTMSWASPLVTAMILVAIASPFYILAVKGIVQFVRGLQFKWRYEPKLKAFLQSATPHLNGLYLVTEAPESSGPR